MNSIQRKLLTIGGYILLVAFCFWGVFGIPASLLFCGVAGVAIGVYRKDKSIWRPSLIVLVIDVICIVVFFLLLGDSKM